MVNRRILLYWEKSLKALRKKTYIAAHFINLFNYYKALLLKLKLIFLPNKNIISVNDTNTTIIIYD